MISRPFHTLLLAILPVLQILSVNRQTISFGEGMQSFMLAIVFGLAVWAVFALAFRSIECGAIPTSVFLLLFYVYTPLQLGLLDNSWVSLSRNTVLVPFLCLVIGVVIWVSSKKKKEAKLKESTQKLNVFSIIVCLLPLLSFISSENNDELARKENPLAISTEVVENLPNIYWIVLDAYARGDVFLNKYNFDNRDFLQGLENRGFTVDSLARSNYSQTSLSIASMLNGDYLENLSNEIVPSSNDRRLLTKLIRDNNLSRALRKQGYQAVTFSTGYALTEDPNSDKYFGSRHFLGRNPITGSLIKRTPLRLLSERVFLPFNGYEWHRDRVNDSFSLLQTMPDLDGPYFAFAHLVSPHKPYIFSKSGEFSAPDGPFSFTETLDYKSNEDSLYIGQVQYINSKVLETIDAIKVREVIEPIIIIQADHGPDVGSPSDRMKILQAQFFPQGVLAESSSSVNTSRSILNYVFETNIAHLENRYYWSSYEEPFDFREK